MNICKCCDNICKGYVCTTHAYDYRYLKKLNISEQNMKSICAVKTNLPVRYKIIMWKNGFLSHPTCVICDKKLSDKKILVNNGNSSSCCSPECYSSFKIKNKKHDDMLLSNISCDIKRELKKFTCLHLDEYIPLLLNKYDGISEDLLFINKLYINGLDDLPNCKFCGSKHDKTRHQTISDCCSSKCANSYKNSKLSYNDIFRYYIERNISVDFLITIDPQLLSSIYSNKKRDITECHCGNFTITTYCSKDCRNKDNMSNIINFNYDGFINFISKNKFDSAEAMKYFNCSISTINRYKDKFGIKVRNKYTVEDDVIEEISKYINEEPKRNDRSVIKPKELDILYSKFAIEYNGLIWHSKGKMNLYDEGNFDSNLHITKTNLCELKNIKLFHIFENEWKRKRPIWSNIISDFYNEITATASIFAQTIEYDVAQKFINDNYLERVDVTDLYNIALTEDNNIISVCSFRHNKMEVFCTAKYNFDTSLIEKCVEFYLNQNNFKYIDIYLNRRWQHYILNDNFKFMGNTEPYKYYILKNLEVINEIDFNSRYENYVDFREIYDSGRTIARYTVKCIN